MRSVHLAPVGAAGAGLVGSGLFVTDPVAGFPPAPWGGDAGAGAPAVPSLSRSGTLHNLCAIPIFVGIPVASLLSAVSSARRRDYLWAGLSAGSSLAMAGGFLLFGASFGGATCLATKGGIFQRVSVVAGFSWLSVISLRGLTSVKRGSFPIRT
jgi:Protein of unknown function (DUF998)